MPTYHMLTQSPDGSLGGARMTAQDLSKHLRNLAKTIETDGQIYRLTIEDFTGTTEIVLTGTVHLLVE